MTIDKKYEVEFTNECRKEIKKIYNYISSNLYAKIAKYKSTEMIYRRIPVDNYLILYTVDEKNKKVYVAHFYYAGSNYRSKI